MTSDTKASSSEGNRWPTIAVVVLCLVFVGVLGTLSLLRYAAIHAHTDLAVYSQVVWNTAHGDWFRNSVLPFTENYLGNHFTPILAAFAPIFAIWPDPRVLLIAQVLTAALTAWPLYWLSREELPTSWAGVLLVAALFVYPAMHHQNLVDFHGIALATPIVMLAFYALLTRRDRLLMVSMLLMVLVREDLPLIIIMMGVYAFLVQRRRRFGLFLAALGVALSVLVIGVLIPAFRGQGQFYYNDYYDYLGDSPAAMLRTMFTRPRVLLSRIFYPPKGQLLLELLAPVAFLPVLVPSTFLLGGSALAYMLLVDFPFHHIYRLNSQYQALFIPVIFAGTVLALARLVRWLGPRWGQRRVALGFGSLVLASSAIALVFWGPLAQESKRAEFRPDEQSRAEWALIAQIPPDAGVVASGRLTAPVSTREGFYRFGGLFEYPYPLDYLLYTDTPEGYPVHPPALVGAPTERGWEVPRYEQVGRVGTTELRRLSRTLEASAAPAPLSFGEAVALRGATAFGQTLVAQPGQPFEVALVWESLEDELPRLVFFAQLIERRPEGEYRWASTDREVYRGLFPTDSWFPGAIVGDVFTFDIPSWMPPGQYELEVGAYTRDDMARLPLPNGQTTAVVATMDIPSTAMVAGSEAPAVPIEIGQILAPGLELRGRTPIPEQATAGQGLDVTLFWHATKPLADLYEARFELVPEGETAAAAGWTQPLLQGRWPNTDWPPGITVADWFWLPIPPDLSPGRYHLEVALVDGGSPAGRPVRLVTLEIEPGD